MPRGDRTGPEGMGPMTGRGMGYCSGYDTPGFANPAGAGFGRGMARGWGRGGGGFGRGMAWGRGMGRGWGRGGGGYGRGGYGYWGAPAAFPAPTPEDERTYLEIEMESLKAHMESIKKRLDQLSTSGSEK